MNLYFSGKEITSHTMNKTQITVKALGLCSGGLDSILSALVLRSQGIDVEWISFVTPFFSSEKAKRAARVLNIPLIEKNITSIYTDMLKNPPMGYGKNMNPCMDCHALMFRLAGEIMKKKGIHFLFSGEVAGQRPFSQTKQSLRYVEKHSGFDGHILRPLSARLLPETIPEKEGWVKRELLFDISGRSRKPQMALAKQFGVTDYPAPAGGCLLTEKSYSVRLKDLFEHQESYTENELHLLKYGRHFRLKNKDKVIVGRTKQDNESILTYHNPEMDTVIKAIDIPGPIVLVPNSTDDGTIMLAASVCVGYGKAPNDTPVDVSIATSKTGRTIQVIGISPEKLKGMML